MHNSTNALASIDFEALLSYIVAGGNKVYAPQGA